MGEGWCFEGGCLVVGCLVGGNLDGGSVDGGLDGGWKGVIPKQFVSHYFPSLLK